ncbi:beta-ketoacyl synthase N-terminal-like domain-containing protein [Halopseudomonas salegens]|uniref:3-oxoacyl-[acyl-carrier-protein] synthase-1 n=1 Tax=Halopseudomonas salegens TaxID=1434072 RepID=A0A1H2GU32_9GAMM|nr:beta-ketoacyl synthase N-terminal-like domain-containing protein [Halopseudomonas salegens]SDU23190.1 3-oxoacyl-[acyl-carrier-protein] synthase-1 [Halopseudomonas salegens]
MQVCLSAYDAHCALGRGVDACVDQLLAGGVAVGQRQFDDLNEPLTLPYFGIPAAGDNDADNEPDLYRCLNQIAAGVLAKAGLDAAARQRTAILLGSSSFDVQVSEQRYQADLQERGDAAVPMPIVGYGKLAERLASELALSEYRFTYSTACTSSANALLYGQRLISAGLVDHALVIGLEWRNLTSILGFAGLGLLSPTASMRPFQSGRDGLLLGEAIGCVLLSHPQYAATNTPRLAGGAIATDNHSLTAANIDGSELAMVIRLALQDSGIESAQIKGIKAHATASLKNDEAESAAIRQVLGDTPPPLFALKPFCGHTLGACGALELALTLGCMSRGVLPGNRNIQCDESLGISLLGETIPADSGYYLLNSFAFGGNNNALVIHYSGSEAPPCAS